MGWASGRHALITGGGTGIGAATARMLVAEGARVTLLGRRREPLEEVAAEFGGGGHTNASGFTQRGDFADVRRGVVDRLVQALAGSPVPTRG